MTICTGNPERDKGITAPRVYPRCHRSRLTERLPGLAWHAPWFSSVAADLNEGGCVGGT